MFDGAGPVVATAIHAGHSLRPEVAARLALDETVRLREEDPYTDRLTDAVPLALVVDRSRFEVDLNRPRDQAVYLSPDQAWGLKVWKGTLAQETVAASLDIYDLFYQELAQRLDQLSDHGPFVVLDIHSYNHRRQGPTGPADEPSASPDINIGTESLDRGRWARVIDRFTDDLRASLPEATIAENVRFKGGYLAKWIHGRYPRSGCALALEFKKTFMDEWTGELDVAALGTLQDALANTVPGILSALETMGRGSSGKLMRSNYP